jgi:hypothetical protein
MRYITEITDSDESEQFDVVNIPDSSRKQYILHVKDTETGDTSKVWIKNLDDVKKNLDIEGVFQYEYGRKSVIYKSDLSIGDDNLKRDIKRVSESMKITPLGYGPNDVSEEKIYFLDWAYRPVRVYLVEDAAVGKFLCFNGDGVPILDIIRHFNPLNKGENDYIVIGSRFCGYRGKAYKITFDSEFNRKYTKAIVFRKENKFDKYLGELISK